MFHIFHDLFDKCCCHIFLLDNLMFTSRIKLIGGRKIRNADLSIMVIDKFYNNKNLLMKINNYGVPLLSNFLSSI